MILNPRRYWKFDELFAEFMGWFKDSDEKWWAPNARVGTKTLHFHDKWDWLMPVVEKIANNDDCIFTIGEKDLRSAILRKTESIPLNFHSSEEKTFILNIYNICYQYLTQWKEKEENS